MPDKDLINRIRIRRLSNELANQIAAGEVIERPASVLKELLENSLDANSTHIDVVIERGGIGLIKVQDNGHGIYKEDLELAIMQHATSKILATEDLEAILSYGFRGEALASISSVSKVSLTSCTESQETGWTLNTFTPKKRTSHPLSDSDETLMPSPKILGTTIEVRDLFYNTPARRKFLRSEKTEMHYLEQVFKRIVLSHPEVGFSLKTSAKNIKRYNRCLTQEAYSRRIAALCTNHFIENTKYIEAESNGLILKGWLGNENEMRATADLQYFYVNGRIVRDKSLNHAVRQAYQDICSLGRYPAYILFLELDPAMVDVNVHPTKHEVRFREARTVHAFITYALSESLGVLKVPEMIAEAKAFNRPASMQAMQLEALQLQEAMQAFKEERTKDTDNVVYTKNTHSAAYTKTPSPSYRSALSEIENSIGNPIEFVSAKEKESIAQPAPSVFEQTIQTIKEKPLCLLGNTLLLLEEDQGFCLVDIKAIYQQWIEQTLENQMNDYFQNKEHSDESMNERDPDSIQSPLLMPLPIRFQTLQNMSSLKNIEQPCQRLGFFWTEMGPQSILLRTVPKIFMTKNSHYPQNPQLFENLLQTLIKLEFDEKREFSDCSSQALSILINCVAQHMAEHNNLSLGSAFDLYKTSHLLYHVAHFKSRTFTLQTLKRLMS